LVRKRVLWLIYAIGALAHRSLVTVIQHLNVLATTSVGNRDIGLTFSSPSSMSTLVCSSISAIVALSALLVRHDHLYRILLIKLVRRTLKICEQSYVGAN
jgi:hypothetical protein